MADSKAASTGNYSAGGLAERKAALSVYSMAAWRAGNSAACWVEKWVEYLAEQRVETRAVALVVQRDVYWADRMVGK